MAGTYARCSGRGPGRPGCLWDCGRGGAEADRAGGAKSLRFTERFVVRPDSDLLPAVRAQSRNCINRRVVYEYPRVFIAEYARTSAVGHTPSFRRASGVRKSIRVRVPLHSYVTKDGKANTRQLKIDVSCATMQCAKHTCRVPRLRTKE